MENRRNKRGQRPYTGDTGGQEGGRFPQESNEALKNPLLSDDDSFIFVPKEVIQAFDSILDKMNETKQELVKASNEKRGEH